jgi:hypothetical protein
MVAIGLVCFLGFALWYQRAHPRQIIAEGSIIVQAQRAGGGTRTLKTRDVKIANATFREVQMPNGTWIDCAGDCQKAVHEAGEGFWDAKQPPGPAR